MSYWAAYFYFSFTLAYAVDSYNSNTSEMLIAMNLGKQYVFPSIILFSSLARFFLLVFPSIHKNTEERLFLKW